MRLRHGVVGGRVMSGAAGGAPEVEGTSADCAVGVGCGHCRVHVEGRGVGLVVWVGRVRPCDVVPPGGMAASATVASMR